MKELSIEEKAKRYDEAIQRARNIVNSINVGLIGKESFEAVFPELKESEDERIRKELIAYCQVNMGHTWHGIKQEDYIAWLERQGKNDMGISEATKKKLEDNLNKALEKETPESWNKFLDGGDPVKINPTEFDTRLQALIGKFDSLPKEELIGSLSFWMNVIQNDWTYKSDEKQGKQKPVAKYKVGDTIYYNSFGRLVSFVIANIVEDGTDNPMYEDKDGNSVFQNDIIERKPAFEMITPEESLGIDSDTYNKIVDECIYGEQKSSNKVEPKFKVGDWIVNNNNKYVYQVTKVIDDEYCLCPLDAKVMGYLRIIDIDNDCHLWTIQDAKDGDVLAEDSCIFIIQKLGDNSTAAKTYCTLYDDGDFDDGSILYFDIDSTKPATKEQRDLLFSKINEAGYEWDNEKKELKEIIDENQIKKNLQENSFRRMFEQKPICNEEQHEKESLSEIENRIINFAMQFHDNRMKPEAEWEDELKMLRDNIKIDPWSEEDEKMLNDIIMCGEHHCYLDAGNIAWLKFFKDRVLSKQEWSEEDESILSHIINDLKFLKNTISIDPNYIVNITDIEREINWFKSLKDRIQPQTKQEWSEKDELMLEESIGFIKSSPYPYAGDTLRGEISKTEAVNWIKHLKNRVQPQQELSEEDAIQIEMLKVFIRTKDWTNEHINMALNIVDKSIKKLNTLKLKNRWKPSDEQMDALYTYIYNPQYFNSPDPRMELVESVYKDLKKLKKE